MTPSTNPLRARRDSAVRLPVLDCGCADPYGCHCTDNSTPPVRALHIDLDSMAAAARALIRRTDRCGIWRPEDVRALWTRNSAGDRELAEKIARMSGWSSGDAVAA